MFLDVIGLTSSSSTDEGCSVGSSGADVDGEKPSWRMPKAPSGKAWHYNHHSNEWKLVEAQNLPPQHDIIVGASLMLEEIKFRERAAATSNRKARRSGGGRSNKSKSVSFRLDHDVDRSVNCWNEGLEKRQDSYDVYDSGDVSKSQEEERTTVTTVLVDSPPSATGRKTSYKVSVSSSGFSSNKSKPEAHQRQSALSTTTSTTDRQPKHTQQQQQPKVDADGVVRHVVQPTDTFQGLCLRYKVKAMALRRANKFSGSNLLLAPSVLVIPIDPMTLVDVSSPSSASPTNTTSTATTTKKGYQAPLALSPLPTENVISAVMHALDDGYYGTANFTPSQARMYLEMNKWNVDRAIAHARRDAAAAAHPPCYDDMHKKTQKNGNDESSSSSSSSSSFWGSMRLAQIRQ